jgi:hypothetical protein
MSIPILPRYLLKAGDLCALANGSIDVLESSPVADDTYLADMLMFMRDDRAAVIDAYGDAREDTFAAPLRAADDARDTVCVQLSKMLDGRREDFDTAVAAAASRLYGLVKKHAFFNRRRSYETQSMTIYAFLDDLNQPDMRTAVRMAHAASGIEALARAQRDFEAVVQESLHAEKEKSKPVSVLMDPLYQDLVDLSVYVNSRMRNRADTYGGIAHKIAELAADMETKVRTRHAREQAAKDQAGAPSA